MIFFILADSSKITLLWYWFLRVFENNFSPLVPVDCPFSLRISNSSSLKTLFNIVEAPIKKFSTLTSVLYDDVQMDQ